MHQFLALIWRSVPFVKRKMGAFSLLGPLVLPRIAASSMNPNVTFHWI